MKGLKIAVSGKSGCGNTTVCGLLAARIGCRCVNFTFRNLAAERGMSLEEVLRAAACDDAWDRELDERQLAMAREEGSCVLGSRLAVWMLAEADVKVCLAADGQTRARRIMGREGGDFASVEAFTRERDRQDSARYRRLYGIDNDDFSAADLVVNAGRFAPEKIVDIIMAALPKKA
jgi:cytidylate kinase